MNSWVSKLFGRSTSASNRRQQKGSKPKVQHPYRGVKIYSKKECCDAARRISGQKFLAAHAPQLPLGGCDHPERCECRYKHLSDRRSEIRRDADHGLPGTPVHSERRNRSDRRKLVH